MLGDLTPIDAFAQRFRSAPIPEASLDVMRLCLLDWAICGLGAKDDPIAKAMYRHAVSLGAGAASVFHTREATAKGAADRLAARGAALINGALSHALDFDDTHFAHIGHVSTVVISAALAVAETEGADFDSFVQAARIGAEVAVRVGLWLGRTHYQAGWHQTATAGAYGAAVASAVLMDAPVTETVLNVAGMAAGQKSQFGSAMKPMNAGFASAQGVEAAQLAKLGLAGSKDVLAGVLATQAGEGNRAAFDGLGDAWVFDDVSHKFHACCHGTHAMIEALISLGPFVPADIAHVDVTTNPRWMTVCNKSDPETWLQGKFSYRFLAALILQNGRTIDPEPEGYFPLSSDTRSIMNKVDVRSDGCVSETASRVKVRLNGGEVKTAVHDLATPMPLSERRKKLGEKGRALLTSDVTAEVEDAIDAKDMALFTLAIRRV